MKLQRSRVFDEAYKRYQQEICQLDFLAKAEILGVKIGKGVLVLKSLS